MGVISSVIFMTRNTDKCIRQKDTGRGAVAACQAASSLDGVASSSQSIFSNVAKGAGEVLKGADSAIESAFSKIGGEKGLEALDSIKLSTGASSKIGALAQSAVNPLLCLSAGARVLKDDDQYAALIEETSAMGAMFGCEALMKYARSTVTGSKQATKGLSGQVAKVLDNSNSTVLKTVKEKASGWFKNLAKGNNGSIKQTAAKIGIDLLFVAGSILAYNAGHKIGTVLSHRNEKNNHIPEAKTTTP